MRVTTSNNNYNTLLMTVMSNCRNNQEKQMKAI